jgi:hypothetical protein
MTASVLYQWPAAARFGRVVPKTKFYEHGRLRTATRQKFVDEVQRITWAFKLANSTVHLLGSKEVPEIQIFAIDVKGDGISEVVLAAIDRAVAFPIIFEITRNHGDIRETRVAACHKDLAGRTPKLSSYCSIPWLPSDVERSPLPPALDLASLYDGLLAPMLPVSARAGERLAEATERVGLVRKLEREIATLQRRLRAEPQLNRKVDLRRELKEREATLAALTDSAPNEAYNGPKKDAQWTS